MNQQFPNVLDAGPNSRPYQFPRAGLLCAMKKNKTKIHTHNMTHVCTLHFYSVFGNMFATWHLQQLLLLHDSCNICFHAWCCCTLIASTIFKNPVYVTNHWLDSGNLVATKTSRLRLLQKLRNSKICRLCWNVSTNFQKSVITTSKLKFCELYQHFSYLCYFLPADATDKKYVELKKFHKSATFQNFGLLLQNFAT